MNPLSNPSSIRHATCLEGQRLQTQFTKQIEAKTKPMHQLVYVIIVTTTKSRLDYKIQLYLNQITNTLCYIIYLCYIMISKPGYAYHN
jgi:hypothetical protein